MNSRRRVEGVVVSNKMEKTVIVETTRTYRHPLYKKVVHERKRLMAHDEVGCQLGDQVRIVESKPFSRRKKWMVEEVLRHDIAAQDEISPVSAADLAEMTDEVEAEQ